jgi:hypothetical protein
MGEGNTAFRGYQASEECFGEKYFNSMKGRDSSELVLRDMIPRDEWACLCH